MDVNQGDPLAGIAAKLVEKWRDESESVLFDYTEQRIKSQCAYELEAALREAVVPPPASGWQPIETAPKNTRILALIETGLSPRVIQGQQWSNGNFAGWIDDSGYWPMATDIVGWQPLPVAPRREGGEGQ